MEVPLDEAVSRHEPGPAGSGGLVPLGPTFPGLDGIRAVAALLVVVNHFDAAAELTNPGYLAKGVQAWVERFGNLGVAVFFALSGFLLFRVFVQAFVDRRPFPRVAPYFLRRFVRIFPAYWVVLFVFIEVMGDAQVHSVLDGVTYFGLLQNYRFGYLPLGLFTAWTLVIEVSFYVVLPLIAWLTARVAVGTGRAQRSYLGTVWLLIGVGVASRAWSLWVLTPRSAATGSWLRLDHVDQWLIGYLDWFAVGMLLAVLHVRFGGPRLRLREACEWLGQHTWRPWLVALLCYWLVVRLHLPRWEFVGFTDLQAFGRGILLPAAAVFLILPLVFGEHDRGFGRRVLSTRAMRALGAVSYGIYLWHIPVIREVDRWAGAGEPLHEPAVRFVVVLVATIAVATASYWIVERPLMRLARAALPS